MTQAPMAPRGGYPLVRHPPTLPSARRAFPTERFDNLNIPRKAKRTEERRCSYVVIDPTQKTEALPPFLCKVHFPYVCVLC